jgi:uncharacterized protein YjbI with pentapeptide repeats
MHRGGLLDDLLTPSDSAILGTVASAPDSNFIKLMEVAGLDRSRDLRHIDLSGVDFSDCDLRGCDFSGSDLRGAIGQNVVWDETTKFDGADVDLSVFAYEIRKREIVLRLPELGREYTKIRKAYWSDQALWVMDAVTAKGKHSTERRVLALELFFDAKDAVVRNTILQFLVFTEEAGARIDFINRILSDDRAPQKAVLSALRIMSGSFAGSEAAAVLLMAYLERPKTDSELRTMALIALLKNRFALKFNRRVLALVKASANQTIENLYMRAFARAIGRDHLTVVAEGRQYGGMVLGEPIDAYRLSEISDTLIRARIVQEALSQSHNTIFPGLTAPQDFKQHVLELLEDLRDRGLDIRIDPSVRNAELRLAAIRLG